MTATKAARKNRTVISRDQGIKEPNSEHSLIVQRMTLLVASPRQRSEKAPGLASEG
ncbi:hypothetical protein [Synechococcus sp. MIT S9507]|uniref:hypothetical protein n=1 Tax=Synechococcus sp. MIT S9507 TaxID=3082544 RepID=UPI0039B6DEC1